MIKTKLLLTKCSLIVLVLYDVKNKIKIVNIRGENVGQTVWQHLTTNVTTCYENQINREGIK